ncbi:MAG: ABC-F family ATP-binding cassette domain-containing protein [Alkalispirochaetaceae bacterium]
MITVQDLKLSFGNRVLFKEVDLKFTPGNCYGVIGANGSGKSTFLKLLSGEIEPDGGSIAIGKEERLAMLRQDQHTFDGYTVLDTVYMGYEKLYRVMKEREAIYEKEEFSEEDGMRASQLESDFAEIGGWEAEAEAGQLLSGLGVEESLFEKKMADLDGGERLRVLLAQALFGNPDILLLDEPTNGLDLESINWLEDFLLKFPNILIVVSHDRHFLNTICTHICDIDYGHIRMQVGNYDFWYQASSLMRKQMKDQKKRAEERAAELKAFIQRFSSNAAKSKQATSRKKLLDQLTLEDMPVTSRRFPYVNFKPDRECGKVVLEVKGLSKSVDGIPVFEEFDFTVEQGEKIAFVGPMNQKKALLFELLAGYEKPDAGTIDWGVTIKPSFFFRDNSRFFTEDLSIIDWLKQFSTDPDETYVRSFLGRMLFSGEEAEKSVKVLSGGERVRCVLSRMMLSGANVLVLDEPTNHLDLEAITALNNGLIDFSEVVLFHSRDHQFVDTVANRIVEFTPEGSIDRLMRFDDYLSNPEVQSERDRRYHAHARQTL